jgi:hypothetical protein
MDGAWLEGNSASPRSVGTRMVLVVLRQVLGWGLAPGGKAEGPPKDNPRHERRPATDTRVLPREGPPNLAICFARAISKGPS